MTALSREVLKQMVLDTNCSETFCVVKVVRHVEGPLADGSVIREVADTKVYIKAIFTKEALDLCRKEWTERQDSQCDSQELEDPDWSQAIISIKHYGTQFQSSFHPENKSDKPRFLLVVHKFVIWDLNKGFDLTYQVSDVMRELEVWQKACQLEMEMYLRQEADAASTTGAGPSQVTDSQYTQNINLSLLLEGESQFALTAGEQYCIQNLEAICNQSQIPETIGDQIQNPATAGSQDPIGESIHRPVTASEQYCIQNPATAGNQNPIGHSIYHPVTASEQYSIQNFQAICDQSQIPETISDQIQNPAIAGNQNPIGDSIHRPVADGEQYCIQNLEAICDQSQNPVNIGDQGQNPATASNQNPIGDSVHHPVSACEQYCIQNLEAICDQGQNPATIDDQGQNLEAICDQGQNPATIVDQGQNLATAGDEDPETIGDSIHHSVTAGEQGQNPETIGDQNQNPVMAGNQGQNPESVSSQCQNPVIAENFENSPKAAGDTENNIQGSIAGDEDCQLCDKSAQSHGPTAESHGATAESHSPTAENHSPTAESHDTTTGSHGPSAQSHSLTAQSHSLTAQSHSLTAGSCGPTAGSHSPTAENHSPAAESHNPTTESHGQSAGSHSPTAERHSPSAGSQSPTVGIHSPTAESHGPTAEEKKGDESHSLTAEEEKGDESHSPTAEEEKGDKSPGRTAEEEKGDESHSPTAEEEEGDESHSPTAEEEEGEEVTPQQLAKLLEAMHSLNSATHSGPCEADSDNTALTLEAALQQMVALDVQNFTVSTEQQAVLDEIPEWKEDFVPPPDQAFLESCTSSEEVSQSRQNLPALPASTKHSAGVSTSAKSDESHIGESQLLENAATDVECLSGDSSDSQEYETAASETEGVPSRYKPGDVNATAMAVTNSSAARSGYSQQQQDQESGKVLSVSERILSRWSDVDKFSVQMSKTDAATTGTSKSKPVTATTSTYTSATKPATAAKSGVETVSVCAPAGTRSMKSELKAVKAVTQTVCFETVIISDDEESLDETLQDSQDAHDDHLSPARTDQGAVEICEDQSQESGPQHVNVSFEKSSSVSNDEDNDVSSDSYGSDRARLSQFFHTAHQAVGFRAVGYRVQEASYLKVCNDAKAGQRQVHFSVQEPQTGAQGQRSNTGGNQKQKVDARTQAPTGVASSVVHQPAGLHLLSQGFVAQSEEQLPLRRLSDIEVFKRPSREVTAEKAHTGVVESLQGFDVRVPSPTRESNALKQQGFESQGFVPSGMHTQEFVSGGESVIFASVDEEQSQNTGEWMDSCGVDASDKEHGHGNAQRVQRRTRTEDEGLDTDAATKLTTVEKKTETERNVAHKQQQSSSSSGSDVPHFSLQVPERPNVEPLAQEEEVPDSQLLTSPTSDLQVYHSTQKQPDDDSQCSLPDFQLSPITQHSQNQEQSSSRAKAVTTEAEEEERLRLVGLGNSPVNNRSTKSTAKKKTPADKALKGRALRLGGKGKQPVKTPNATEKRRRLLRGQNPPSLPSPGRSAGEETGEVEASSGVILVEYSGSDSMDSFDKDLQQKAKSQKPRKESKKQSPHHTSSETVGSSGESGQTTVVPDSGQEDVIILTSSGESSGSSSALRNRAHTAGVISSRKDENTVHIGANTNRMPKAGRAEKETTQSTPQKDAVPDNNATMPSPDSSTHGSQPASGEQNAFCAQIALVRIDTENTVSTTTGNQTVLASGGVAAQKQPKVIISAQNMSRTANSTPLTPIVHKTVPAARAAKSVPVLPHSPVVTVSCDEDCYSPEERKVVKKIREKRKRGSPSVEDTQTKRRKAVDDDDDVDNNEDVDDVDDDVDDEDVDDDDVDDDVDVDEEDDDDEEDDVDDADYVPDDDDSEFATEEEIEEVDSRPGTSATTSQTKSPQAVAGNARPKPSGSTSTSRHRDAEKQPQSGRRERSRSSEKSRSRSSEKSRSSSPCSERSRSGSSSQNVPDYLRWYLEFRQKMRGDRAQRLHAKLQLTKELFKRM